MTWRDALLLGRVSNLPTVWSNVLAGTALAGSAWQATPLMLSLVALSLAYVAGMFLNDAFDAETDAAERPERPIPAGRVDRRDILAAAVTMLAGAVMLLGSAGAVAPGGGPAPPAIAGLGLAGVIVAYDRFHKHNPWSPLLMALCRVLVYVSAALAIAPGIPPALVLGALALLAWVMGLTYTAKQESLGRFAHLWPLGLLAVPIAYGAIAAVAQPLALAFVLLLAAATVSALWLIAHGYIPPAIGALIAAIALVDAVLIAGAGAPGTAVIAALAFPITLVFQRLVPGT